MSEGMVQRMSALERENASLRRAISLLHEVSTLVRASLELESTCYAVLTGVTAGVGLGLNRAILFLVDENERDVLRAVAAVGPSDPRDAEQAWRSIEQEAPDLMTLYEAGLRRRRHPDALDHRIRLLEVPATCDSPVARALRRAAPVVAEGEDDLGGLLHLPTSIAAPLRGRGSVHGVLYADNGITRESLDAVDEMVFAMIADHAGRAIETAHRYERIAREARTDSLTGLGHHGSLMEALAEEVQRATIAGTGFAVAMVDLDDFKRVNDTHGHLVGDTILAGAAERLRSRLRGDARAFRYGGEEFTVLLPGVGPGSARTVAERLRETMASRPFRFGESLELSVTCSVGVACHAPGRSTPVALLDAADQALLRAKQTGKNRVVLAAPTPEVVRTA